MHMTSSSLQTPSSSGASSSMENREGHLGQMVSDVQLSSFPVMRSSPPASATDDVWISDNIDVMKTKLTSSSPRSRAPRHLTLPSPYYAFDSLPRVEISVPINYTHHNKRQDVRSRFVNPSAPYQTSSSVTRHVYPATPLESPASSFSDPHLPNGTLNSRTSLRTSTPVFNSAQDLAAHYGIPQILPPAPNTTPRRTTSFENNSSFINFTTLSSNYLNMLRQKSDDNTMTSDTAQSVLSVPPTTLQSQVDADAVKALMDVLGGSHSFLETEICMTHAVFTASPEFASSPDFSPESTSPDFDMNEFMTSPYDSPFPDSLDTPLIGLGDMDAVNMMTSPLIEYGIDDFDGPLFLDSFDSSVGSKPSYEPPAPQPNFDNMYTMTPPTPALDPSSIYPSPRLPSGRSIFPTPAPTRRKSSATGTRKNVTPEKLLDLDAPTQQRKYITPSATSRKDIPAAFAKKRARSQAFGDEEDELEEAPLGPNATEKEQIEWKRRQNTLAARKSRKRKLEHQQQLEDMVARLTTEKDVWKTRALTFKQMLIQGGVDVGDFTGDFTD